MKTIYYIITFFLAINFNCLSQNITFSDPIFKSALINIVPNNARNLLGLPTPVDLNQDGEIQISEALNISTLGLVNLPNEVKFSNLSGLEYFTNLKGITIAGNNVSAFNFPMLTLMETLDLQNNPISSVDVSTYPNLKYFITGNTQISSINLNALNNLTSYTASNSPIAAIDIKNNPNLVHLRFGNTNVSTLNIKNTNINFNESFILADCWQNTPLTYICCDAEDVPALTTFLTNCGHNLANITIDTTQTCALSTGAIKSYNIAVYPNPSTGIFNITLPTVFNGNIEVFNTLGQKVYDHAFENEQHMVLDLGHLNKGVYFLKVQNAQGDMFEEKIIIAP